MSPSDAIGTLIWPSVQNRLREISHSQPDMAPAMNPEIFDAPGRGRRMIGHAWWSLKTILRTGLPKDMYWYNGGIGDEMLMTTVFHELRRRGQPLPVMMSAYPELFTHNPDVGQLLPWNARYLALAERFGRKVTYPCYLYEHIKEADCHYCPPYPMIARMCKVSGMCGPVDIRPYLYLTEDEKRAGQRVPRQVAIMSNGLSALYKHLNKQWFPERYQAVVDALKDRFNFVQIGSAGDPPLEGALDLRGKTTLRETGAVLSQSQVFIGQIGFLMHLARAVDCRAVMVYGGREHPLQTGYSCYENLYTPVPCAPCWKCNQCDFDRECLRRIQPEHVIDAALRQVEMLGTPLPVDTYTIVPEYDGTEEITNGVRR